MVNCFQFCFIFAFKFNLRRYMLVSRARVVSLESAARTLLGRGLQSSTSQLNLSRV